MSHNVTLTYLPGHFLGLSQFIVPLNTQFDIH